MKHICKKCNKQIPTKIILDGKTKLRCSRRKYCFDCIPHGKRKLNPIGTKKCICNICHKEYFYSRTKGCSTTKCVSCSTINSRRNKKQKAINYLGGKCQKCGYNKCIKALCFHHKDRTTKKYNLSAIYHYCWEKWIEELDKCELLCANCHTEVEDEIYQSGVSDLNRNE